MNRRRVRTADFAFQGARNYDGELGECWLSPISHPSRRYQTALLGVFRWSELGADTGLVVFFGNPRNFTKAVSKNGVADQGFSSGMNKLWGASRRSASPWQQTIRPVTEPRTLVSAQQVPGILDIQSTQADARTVGTWRPPTNVRGSVFSLPREAGGIITRRSMAISRNPLAEREGYTKRRSRSASGT